MRPFTEGGITIRQRSMIHKEWLAAVIPDGLQHMANG